MEFKAFPDIKRLNSVGMQITQKIHGTNAQIFIFEVPSNVKFREDFSNESFIDTSVIEVDDKFYELYVGSRSRWIVPGDDNYGFAAHVYANKEEFIRKLGVGQHFGEWAGSGINSGEGLKVKTFILFDYWKYPSERPLPPQCAVVPVLYAGPLDLPAIDNVMEELRVSGSKLVPGFMRPEGIVIQTMGTRFKKVFKAEETEWKKPDENYVKVKKEPGPDYNYLCQPIRLEKLLSRNEKYLVGYPETLKEVVEDYWQDLIKENQITEEFKKGALGQLFKFVRTCMDNPEGFKEYLK